MSRLANMSTLRSAAAFAPLVLVVCLVAGTGYSTDSARAADSSSRETPPTRNIERYGNRVFHSICENSQLAHLLQYRRLGNTSVRAAEGEHVGECVLSFHAFSSARFYLELLDHPGVDELWLLDGSLDDGDAPPALGLKRTAESLEVSVAGQLVERVSLPGREEVRTYLELREGRLKIEADRPAWRWSTDLDGSFHLAIPTAQADCDQCTLAALDIWLDDNEAERWYDSLRRHTPTDRRLNGLDRLVNFTRIDPGNIDSDPEVGATLMPDLLIPTRRYGQARQVEFEREFDKDPLLFEVRDFDVPSTRVLPDLFVRQVLDRNHPRINPQYWALYVNAVKTDAWSFAPNPTFPEAEGKFLAPYEIQDISFAPDGNRLVFRTCGAMLRPGGKAWLQSKDFFFLLEEDGLHLDYVLGALFVDFSASGDAWVMTEKMEEQEGRQLVEIQSAELRQEQLNECGVESPHLEPWSCEEYLAAADCLVGPHPEMRYRELTDLTWIEGGG